MIVISSSLVLEQTGTEGANNPVIGYEQLVTAGNVTADSEDADNPITNVANPATDLRWVSESTAEQFVRIDHSRIDPVDYVGIAEHNLGSAGVSVALEGYKASPEVTNLFQRSDDFANAYWTKQRSSVSSDVETAPTGIGTADKLVEDATAANSHYIARSMSFTADTAYTVSVYAKAAQRSVLAIQFLSTSFGDTLTTYFDLAGGAISGSSGTPIGFSDAGIEDIGGGWFRCWITATAQVTAASAISLLLCAGPTTSSYSGDGVSGLYVWGAQLEASASLGHYVPTTTTSLTDGEWSVLMPPILPADDQPLLLRFEPDSYDAVRLRLTPDGTAPEIGVLYLGKLLVLPHPIYVGHTPITLGRASRVTNARSESGKFLGRIVLQQSASTSVSLQHLPRGWYRTYMKPFTEWAVENPFFFAWRPQEFPNEVGYTWLTGDPRPVNSRPEGFVEVELNLSGIVT